jgi:hypothetical protein
LSDILEEHPDPKYFLSSEYNQKLVTQILEKDDSLISRDDPQTTSANEKMAEPVL